MASKIQVQFGPFVFSSGYVPQGIIGPSRDMYVVEHQIPAAEGGIVEYVGSKQPTYQLKGFLTASNDLIGGPAGAILSGSGYLAVTADAAKDALLNLRASGAQLLRAESTATNTSGYSILYENGFFYIHKAKIAYEAARGYPYYPYVFDLTKASIKTYGNSSGIGNYLGSSGAYFSGYIRAWQQASGFVNGEMVISIGMSISAVASGNAKVAIYSSGGVTLQTQSATQVVHSGWNYFPLQPSFVTTSGSNYTFAIKSDSTSTSGFVLNQEAADAWISGDASAVSGITFSADFPASLTYGTLANVSGIEFDMVMVV